MQFVSGCAGDIIGGVVLVNKAAPGLAALLLLAVFPAAALAAEPMQLVVNGQTRAFLLARPPGPAPRPTIIMLHGLPGTGAAVAGRTGLDQLAPRAGFVAVFPEGLRNRWNHFLPGKEPPLFVQKNEQVGGVPDDAGFLKLLVADLVRRGLSDPKRIYLAGVSNGAFMSMRMICTDAGLFAAVGVLVGGMPERLGADCRPPKPIAALMINGTADQIIPYDGGMVQPGSAFAAWPTERLVAFSASQWSRRDLRTVGPSRHDPSQDRGSALEQVRRPAGRVPSGNRWRSCRTPAARRRSAANGLLPRQGPRLTLCPLSGNIRCISVGSDRAASARAGRGD